MFGDIEMDDTLIEKVLTRYSLPKFLDIVDMSEEEVLRILVSSRYITESELRELIGEEETPT